MSIQLPNIQIESGEKIKVTLSIGVAVYPDDAREKGALLELADQGLYYAKEHGRNQTVALSEM